MTESPSLTVARGVVPSSQMTEGVMNSSPLHVGFGGVVVVVLDGLLGGAELSPSPSTMARVGALDAVPAVVAVHGPVAADDAWRSGRRRSPCILASMSRMKPRPELGGRVAAVHEGVEVDAGEALAFGQLEAGVEVFEEAVDAGVGAEAEEMQAAAGFRWRGRRRR